MGRSTLIAAIIGVTLAGPAMAQTACAERTAVLEKLAERFDERPIALGLAENGAVVEVLASDTTWTILVTTPDGQSCLAASGEGWQALPVKRGSGS